MKKVWYVYHQDNNIGVVLKMNEVFRRIEVVAGKQLTNWDVVPDKIRVVDGLNVYEARREVLH